MGQAGEAAEGGPTLEVLGEQDEGGGCGIGNAGGMGNAGGVGGEVGGRGDIQLEAEQGLEAGLTTESVELKGAGEAVVVGEGQGGHAQIDSSLDQPGRGRQGFEEGVGGVGVEGNVHGATVGSDRAGGDIIRRCRHLVISDQEESVMCHASSARWQAPGVKERDF